MDASTLIAHIMIEQTKQLWIRVFRAHNEVATSLSTHYNLLTSNFDNSPAIVQNPTCDCPGLNSISWRGRHEYYLISPKYHIMIIHDYIMRLF